MAAIKIPTKVKGEYLTSRWMDEHCDKCGCRTRTDGKIVWCSGINCNYWRKAKIVEGVKNA